MAQILSLRYERFVFALEEASRDMLPELKNKALKVRVLPDFFGYYASIVKPLVSIG